MSEKPLAERLTDAADLPLKWWPLVPGIRLLILEARDRIEELEDEKRQRMREDGE